MIRCEQALDLITALVDGEASPEERTSVESHLNDCPQCGLAYRAERALKARVRAAASLVTAPAELRKNILADQRIFPKQIERDTAWRRIFPSGASLLRPAWALAILLLLFVPALYWLASGQPPISSLALTSHAAVSGRADYVSMSDPVALRNYLVAGVDGRFGPMARDLSSINLYPVGGAIQEFNGRKVLLVVFEGTGPSVICYTFAGTEEDAPKDAEVFFDPHMKINFYAFSNGPLNAVMHRSGDLICIFTSEMPMAQLLALARGKAHPA